MSKANHHTTIFERSYKILNAAQRKAVDTIEGPVVVIAGPGTGKTTILTLRIANILKQTDTSPDSILALTFTDSGAQAMRRKLVETIGATGYKVAIHTFHGFAAYLIEKYPDYFPRIIGSRIINEIEQIKIIEKCLNSKNIKILRPYGDPTYYVDPILKEIHTLKRENISPSQLEKSLDEVIFSDKEISRTEKEKQEKNLIKNRELVQIYQAYEKELAKIGCYDFDDMLLEIIRVIENDQIFKLTLQEQYQYILADEHQDANAAQNRILELLSDFHDSPNLFIVGDDKQAIYRFQGASLENFLYFSKKYKDTTVINLEHNYRSHQGILDASHSLIIKNPTAYDQERIRLKSLIVGSNQLRIVEFSTVNDELEGVAAAISALLSAGEVAEEIAVLYRDNRHADDLSKILESENISHSIESDHDIMSDYDITKILILCRAIHDPSNDQYLSAALLLPEMMVDSAEVASICRQASRKKIPLHRLIKSLNNNETKDLRRAYDKINKWSKEAPLLSFTVFLQKLIQETELMSDIVMAPNSLERFYSVQAFFDQVSAMVRSFKNFYLADFIDRLNITEEHGMLGGRKHSKYIKGVRLMTAHRAKGLEFNHVFIIHAVDGIWGNRSSRNHFHVPLIEHARFTGRIDDERRLFYVALTRARQSIMISRAHSDGVKEMIASQFISEIDSSFFDFNIVSSRNINEQLSKVILPKDLDIKTGSVSILQPDFIKSLFINQPLSVTHLNNYLDCPWKYFFVNLIRIPQAENKHQLYGTAIHATLRSFFDAYSKNNDIHIKRFIEIFKNNIENLPFSADEEDESFLKGKKALEGYYLTYKKTWNRHLLNEYAVKGVNVSINNTHLELSGKLDKIEFLSNRDVIVIDYKTGKPKSRNEIEGKIKSSKNNGNYFRQLAFYKLLLDGEGKFNMKYGEIDFIEPNERSKYKKERFEILNDDTLKVKEEITSMANDILSLSFIASKCKDKKCEYCRLGKLLTGK